MSRGGFPVVIHVVFLVDISATPNDFFPSGKANSNWKWLWQAVVVSPDDEGKPLHSGVKLEIRSLLSRSSKTLTSFYTYFLRFLGSDISIEFFFKHLLAPRKQRWQSPSSTVTATAWWRKPHQERVVLRPLMISQASLNSTLFPPLLLPSSHWNVSLFNRATTLTLIAGVQTTMFFFALFPVVHNWNEWKVNSWSSSSRVLHNNGDLSHREKMKETCPLLIFEEWVGEIRGDSRKIKFF